MLRGHDGALVNQAPKAGRVNPAGAVRAHFQTPHVFEPVKQFEDIGGCRRLRIIPQPCKAGAAQFRVDREQSVKCRSLSLGQAICQSLEHALASAHAGCQSDPFQHRRGRNEHVGGAQMGEHCPNDRLAAVRGPCRVRAHLEAGTPIGQPETSKVQMHLQLDGVLPAGLIAERVVGKGGWGYTKLVSDEADHRFRRRLARSQALAGMPQKAQLNSEPKPIDRTALCPDERQIIGAEDIVLCHLGVIDRDGEQAGALLVGQQGAAGHDGLVAMMGDDLS